MAFAGIDTSRVLQTAMAAAEQNHRYIANNIANADTPGYKPVNLDFQKALKQSLESRGGFALRTNRPRHLDFTQRRPVLEDLAFLSKNDYNKVEMEEQMAKLSENTGNYTTYARLLRKKFEQAQGMLDMLNR